MNMAENPHPAHDGESSLALCTNQLGFCALLAISLPAIHAIAADEHVKISAATDITEIHQGESGLLAIELNMEDDWHIYWPGVSDSGYGISINIRTTGSVTLEDPIWPTPERYLQPGDILDHIYEETIMVLVPFHVATGAQLNSEVIFDIDAEFLVCSDICLPGQADATTSLTIINESSEQMLSSISEEIRNAYKARPKEFDSLAEDVRVQWIADAAAIMFRDATKIEFFPSEDCTELADPVVGGLTDSNRLIIKFAQRTDKVLSGRIRSYERAGVVEYDIHIKAPD